MPDMDIDFAVAGRERVINYVTEKYGRDRVAQIITFSTMAARAAVRDAGRVLEIPYGVVDRIAKLIPEGPGQTLEECLKSGAELRKAVDSDPTAKEIVELARPLEGLTRADSIHAAGVVIGAEPLMNLVPLQQKGADQEVVTQFQMKDVEALGLLKMDFLGLRNLDVIDKACELVGGDPDARQPFDIGTIPLDDKATYEMLARGEATGVFQFESTGMREALRQVKPTEFEDVIALVALYRPGPMQYIPSYANRKNGAEAVTYLDPRLKSILGATWGISIYQEQSMEIAKQIAGFSLFEAEDLRRAIGKKDHKLMASLKNKFIEGCIAEQHLRCGRPPALGRPREGTGLLVQQGPRGLLRAHLLPHRLAARAPPVRVHGGADQLRDEHEGSRALLRQRVRGARDRGAAAGRERVAGRLRGRRREDPLRTQRREGRRRARLPHDHPGARGGRAVRVDLGLHRARRPLGRQQAGARVADQVRRPPGIADGDAAGARAGARVRAEAAVRPARRAGARSSTSHFGDAEMASSAAQHHPVVPSEEFEKPDLLRLEKETLGLYVSEHPLSPLRAELRAKTDATIAELERRRDGENVVVGGIVSDVKQITSKRGEQMVFMRLDDVTGGVECVVFAAAYAAASSLCVPDRIVIVKGRVDHKEGETKLLASEITGFESAESTRTVRLRIDATKARAGIDRRPRDPASRLPRRESRAGRLRHLAGAARAPARARVSASSPTATSTPRCGRCSASRRSRRRPRHRPRSGASVNSP